MVDVESNVDYRIQIILKIIEERGILIGITPGEAGRLLGLSESRLRRLFHREVGVTFASYIREKRLAHATNLLQCHDKPIKQVANDCGYDDLSNFYRDFKHAYGTTPKNVRIQSVTSTLPHIVMQRDH